MKNLFSSNLFLLFLLITIPTLAQEVDIIPYLKQIEQGKNEEVKSRLSGLKKDYPKSSNLIFLEGVLTENGQDAVAIYQNILDKYPKSAYADAALYRIYSYYFALGLYNTADKLFTKLKKNYPESPYIKMASMNVTTTEDNPTPPVKTVDQKDETVYKYTVQAGAFTNKDNATALQKEFTTAGMKSVVKEKNVGGTIFNVVYVGQFAGRNEAEDFKQIVNTQFNISGRVVEIEK